jgi:hypothetical protein
LIVGPNLQANTDNGQININAQNLNILSSQDTSNTKSSTDHKNLNVSYTLYGTNSNSLSGNISQDSSTSNSQQTSHNNASLTAANINLNSTQDTRIKGANLHATEQFGFRLGFRIGIGFRLGIGIVLVDVGFLNIATA